VVQALATEEGARLSRALHPLRMQRWVLSDLNPWLSWLPAVAAVVAANRKPAASNNYLRKLESTGSELISASLDGYRGLRDAFGEAAFFQIYGNLFALSPGDQQPAVTSPQPVDHRELPCVKTALAAIDKGGYPEALARVAYLLAHEDKPLPLARLQLAHELLEDYHDLLPELAPAEVRRIGGEQEIIARYERERALETLPQLLPRRGDREKLLALLDRVLGDKRVQKIEPTREQQATLARIREVVGPPHGRALRTAAR
jgi:hypothetical protein